MVEFKAVGSDGSELELGWLLEMSTSPLGHPVYWRGENFTCDQSQAIRFARKIDAERVQERLVDKSGTLDTVAVLHSWGC